MSKNTNPFLKIIGVSSVTGFSGVGVTLMYTSTTSEPLFSGLLGSAYAGVLGYYLGLIYQPNHEQAEEEVDA
jgi:hypothetical protein